MKHAVCPFCKGKLVGGINIGYNKYMNKWTLIHMCEGKHVSIHIVADSEEELYKLWNASQKPAGGR